MMVLCMMGVVSSFSCNLLSLKNYLVFMKLISLIYEFCEPLKTKKIVYTKEVSKNLLKKFVRNFF